jgi:hypothetical protein
LYHSFDDFCLAKVANFLAHRLQEEKVFYFNKSQHITIQKLVFVLPSCTCYSVVGWDDKLCDVLALLAQNDYFFCCGQNIDSA